MMRFPTESVRGTGIDGIDGHGQKRVGERTKRVRRFSKMDNPTPLYDT